MLRLLAKFGDWLGRKYDALPWVPRLVFFLGALTTAAIVVFAAGWQKEIQESRSYLVALVVLACTEAALGSLQFFARPKSITLRYFEGIMRDLRDGVRLRPVAEWRRWDLNTWQDQVRTLCRILEQAVRDEVSRTEHRYSSRRSDEAGDISCNLMIALSPSMLRAIRKYRRIKFAFDKPDEGILASRDLYLYLALVGRGPVARSRPFPDVVLRVPRAPERAFPGAPQACHRVETDASHRLAFDYLSDPCCHNTWAPDVSKARKAVFTGYFQKISPYCGSVLSVAFVWRNTVVGVLNIDSPTRGFLDDPRKLQLVKTLLYPFAEVASALCFVLGERLREEIKDKTSRLGETRKEGTRRERQSKRSAGKPQATNKREANPH